MKLPKEIKAARNEHTALYMLHAIRHLIEQIPTGTGVTSKQRSKWEAEMRTAGDTCLRRMDKNDSNLLKKEEHPDHFGPGYNPAGDL